MASLLVDPSSCKFVFVAFERLYKKGSSIDLDVLDATLNDVVEFHAHLQHGYVVSWALFMLHQFGLPLSSANASQVVTMSDNMCLILLHALDRESLIEAPAPNLSAVVARAEAAGAAIDADWLLAYEFAVQGVTKGANVTAEPLLSVLSTRGVRFFDEVSRPARSMERESGEEEPEYADEAFVEVTVRDAMGTWTYMR